MKIVELRIILPTSLDRFRIAHLYTRHKYRTESNDSKSSTQVEQICAYSRSSSACELNNTSKDWFSNSGLFIQYCHIFHNILPGWANSILGSSTMRMVGNTWDEFPNIYSNYRIPAFPRLRIDMKSTHVDNDIGEQSNVFNLTPSEQRGREIVKVDMRNDIAEDVKKLYTPSEVEKQSVMCVYILIECDVNVMLPAPIKLKGEELAISNIMDVLISLHRLTCTWISEWSTLSFSQVLNYVFTNEISDITTSESVTPPVLPAPPVPVPQSFLSRSDTAMETSETNTGAKPRPRRFRSRL